MNRAALVANWKRLPHPLRWLVAATVGGTLVVVGLVLMVLPGPGIPILLLGLLILATEFAWAESLLRRTRAGVRAASAKVRGRQAK